MTSLDDIQLDEFQELDKEQEELIKPLKPFSTVSKSRWGPIIVTTIILMLVLILNSEWVTSKLENVSYYKYSLMGILFSSILFLELFLI